MSNAIDSIKRILVLDSMTNKELDYENIYLHSEPESNLVSLYNGAICDDNRAIYTIKSRGCDPLSKKLILIVKKL